MKQKHVCALALFVLYCVLLWKETGASQCTSPGCNFGDDATMQCYYNPQYYPADSPFCPYLPDVSCSLGHCTTEIGSTPYGKYACEQIGHWEDPGYCAYTLESIGPCPPKGYPCFCNCYCFAYGTNITMADNSQKEVQNIVKGDKVLVLSDVTTDPPKWQDGPITLSSGSTNNTKSFVLRVEFVGGVIIVNPVQLFYVWDKQNNTAVLVQAGNLDMKNHQLMNKDFDKYNILSLVTGIKQGGLWSLVANGVEKSIPHHLLLAQGVVAGDFFLQQGYINNSTNKTSPLHPANYGKGIGTLEYHKKHGETFTKDDQDRFENSHHPLDSRFRPFHEDYENKAPKHARFFLPREIGSNSSNFIGKLVSTGDRIRYSNVHFVMSVWQGLLPEIKFSLTWASDEVNAYAWIDRSWYGDSLHIQIEGGLARHVNLTWKGIAFIIAREIGQLRPMDSSWTYGHKFPHGYTCEQYSDLIAVLKFSAYCSETADGPTPIFTTFAPQVMNEVSNFLTTLPPYCPKQVTNPGCSFPKGISAQCRNQTFWAGIFNFPIPACYTGGKLSSSDHHDLPHHDAHDHNHDHGCDDDDDDDEHSHLHGHDHKHDRRKEHKHDKDEL